ncbi:MAG TPA: hypothetical protein VMU20_06145 [Candidatus Dormibacteraeota bacterium]|nr:hypothetical protein [Candidatus Dormibacteraeota bacterium]
MSHRRVRLGAAALALLAGAVALVAGAPPARAESPSREQAAAAMRGRLGAATGPAADRDAVLGAWEAAGARLDGVRRHLAANAAPGAIDTAVLLVADLCDADLDLPRDVPEPGDLLLYREPAADGARWRVGMLTGAATAVILAPGGHRLVEVPRGVLLDEVSAASEARLAQPGTVRVCRFSAGLLPGLSGVPTTGGRRRVALVDAHEAVRALQWELDHPRDADTGAIHRFGHVVLTPLALAAGATSALLGGGGRVVGALLDSAGPAPAAALWHLLGRSFDGRRLHAVLTDAGVAAVLGPGALVLDHLAPAAWALRPVHAVASFTVSLVTGVDDSRHVLAGGVLLALACDLLVVAKPLALAARVGAGAPGGLDAVGRGGAVLRRTLDLSTRAGDLVSGRPSTLLRLGGAIPRRRLVHDVLDTASLLLRPSSLPGHLIEGCGRLARWGRTTAETAAAAPAGGHALAAAVHHIGAARLEHIERLAELSHLNSGSRTLAAAIAGELHPFGVDAAPAPPRIRLPVPER